MAIDSGLVAILLSLIGITIAITAGFATRRSSIGPYNDYEAQLREQRAEIARLTIEVNRLRIELVQCQELKEREVGR